MSALYEPMGARLGSLRSPAHDNAWWVVLGASLCMFCGQPAVIIYTFGLFVPAIIATEHWSPAAVASAIGPSALIAALLSPLVGYAADRWGVRRLTLAGGPAFALGLSILGLVPQNPGAFVGCMMIMFALSFSGSPVPYAQAMTGWFSRRRGVAISIMFGCGALGISVWPHVVTALIASSGWRVAYAVTGGTVGVIMVFAALALLRAPPRSVVEAGCGPAHHVGVRAALATRRFWKIAISFMLLTGVLVGCAVGFPILMRHRGGDAELAATALSIVGAMMFLGRMSLGFVLDRWFSPYITIAVALLPVAGLALMITDLGHGSMLVACALLGFGLGSEFNAAAYMTSKAFGLRAFGAIYGMVTLIYGIGSSVGSAAIATMLVTHVSPALVLGCGVAVLLVAILLLLTITRADLSHDDHQSVMPPPAKAG